MHVPIDVARHGVEAAGRPHDAARVAVRGGSTIGLAKWIAHHTGLPIVAVPTTYAGSEMTAIWGLTDNATRYQTTAAHDPLRIAAAALGADDAATALRDLAIRLGVPTALQQIGMPSDGLERAARLVVSQTFYSPAPVDYIGVRRLLADAFVGSWGEA
jgi:maleylacetate reductase